MARRISLRVEVDIFTNATEEELPTGQVERCVRYDLLHRAKETVYDLLEQVEPDHEESTRAYREGLAARAWVRVTNLRSKGMLLIGEIALGVLIALAIWDWARHL
jgi:hypothetical protein